jgi:hypothetical protein
MDCMGNDVHLYTCISQIFFFKIVKDLMGYQNLRIILDFVFD